MPSPKISSHLTATTTDQPAPALQTQEIKSLGEFNNPNDFEGWNCGKITVCGNHQICGGYNVTGKGADMTKTFMLPAGRYSVDLDFIKIDSWFGFMTYELMYGLLRLGHMKQNGG